MAQDRIAIVAERFYRALLLAKPEFPGEIQEALSLERGGSSIAWTLALTLSGYRLRNEVGVPSSLESLGVWKFVSSLGVMMKLMPAELETAMKTAEAADSGDSLAGVGVYLKSAFDSLAGIQRSALVAWLQGEEFRAAAVSFARKYPEPSAASAEKAAAPAPRTINRGRNFDRAGFGVRRTAAPQPTALVSAEVEPPELSPHDITRASLHSLGWGIEDVDRVMSGPNGQHGALYQLRQFLKTYANLKKPERMIFQKIVDETEEGYTKSEWQTVNIAELGNGNVRDVPPLDLKTGVELYRIYKQLPVSDRMKAAKWIFTTERGFTAEDMNALPMNKIPRSELE